MEILIDEYKAQLVKVINESGLPFGVTELILESLLGAVRDAKKQAIDKERADILAQSESEESKE